MPRRAYPTDLTDDEWRVLEPLIPPATPGGRFRSVDPREILNAIRYHVRAGGAWRLVPHEFPPWPTVYAYFRRWEQDHGNRGPRGDDGGKQITGRKRHVLVDTEGFLTDLVVHPANLSESAGAKLVLGKAKVAGRTLAKIWVDGGYQAGVVAWAETELGYPLEVVARPPATKGFAVLPRRWVVERSFAWIGRYRRLSKGLHKHPLRKAATTGIYRKSYFSRR